MLIAPSSNQWTPCCQQQTFSEAAVTINFKLGAGRYFQAFDAARFCVIGRICGWLWTDVVGCVGTLLVVYEYQTRRPRSVIFLVEYICCCFATPFGYHLRRRRW